MRQLLMALGFLTFTLTVQGQADTSYAELKVGLVLSGGGAKGIAHIGALKVLEEAGIRPDFIGGTSMGAIIGALYAAGYSAQQLDSIFTQTELEILIQDEVPRSAKTFYEKEDSERYALTLPFTDFRISFPQSISGGQQVYNMLVQLLYHVRDIEDFNNLQIPFFCMATDVETGEEILLNSGYLPEAIMASGTFPSLFEPAEIEGRLLIDGGVLNNYPVAELREMGANLIIGVDVQHGLRTRDELKSAAEILLQINNYRTVGDMQVKSRLTDIYIKPDIDHYSILDFDQRDTLLALGELAARQQLETLQDVAKAQQYKNPKSLQKINIPDSLKIDRIVLEGNVSYSRDYILGKLRLDIGAPLPFEQLHQGISNLAATGNFKMIRYKIVTGASGLELSLRLQENPNRTFVRLGANYNELYRSAALINITQKHLLFNDDVASLDIILGDNLRYNAEYYVDKGFNWSFGINSRYNQFNKSVPYPVLQSNFYLPQDENINSINLEVYDWTNQVYLQTVLREEFAISLGIEYKYLEYSTKTISDASRIGALLSGVPPASRYFFEKSNYGSVFGTLTLDTYDDKYFPTRGFYADGRFNLYLISSDFIGNFKQFSIAKGSAGIALPAAQNISVNLQAEGGFKLGKSPVTSLDFVLGGFGSGLINNFVSLAGYDFLSLPGNSYLKAHGRMDWEMTPENHIFLTADFANVADDLFRTGDWFSLPSYSGYGLGYARESFFGPLQVAYTWSPEGPGSGIFFSLGFWF